MLVDAILSKMPSPLPQGNFNDLRKTGHGSSWESSRDDDSDETYLSLADSSDVAPPNTRNIQLGEHIAIVGKTGSGKTYFTMTGLLNYLRYQYPTAKRYVIDSSDDPDMETLIQGGCVVVEGDKTPNLLRNSTYTLVWKPRHSKVPKSYATFFQHINDAREPQILIIDEIASMTNEALEELEPLLKQLRKHHGTVIILAQGISGVSTDVFKQCTHYLQFHINNEQYDNTQSRRYLNIDRTEQRAPNFEYGFFYRNQKMSAPMSEYKDVSDFFGRTHTHTTI
jgi:hypothetical protein